MEYGRGALLVLGPIDGESDLDFNARQRSGRLFGLGPRRFGPGSSSPTAFSARGGDDLATRIRPVRARYASSHRTKLMLSKAWIEDTGVKEQVDLTPQVMGNGRASRRASLGRDWRSWAARTPASVLEQPQAQ